MEGSEGPSCRARLFDMLESSLGAQAVDPLRGDGTARNGKKRRISAGPRVQGGQDLQRDLQSLQEHPEFPENKRTETETALATLLLQGCSHTPRTEYLCSLLPPFQEAGLLDWNPLLEHLLAACFRPAAQTLKTLDSGKALKTLDSGKQGSGLQRPSSSSANTPVPEFSRGLEISPKMGLPERLTGGSMAFERPQKESPALPAGHLPAAALFAFQPVLCRVAHLALDSKPALKPLTCLKLLRVALGWIQALGKLQGEEDSDTGPEVWGLDVRAEILDETLGGCLDVVRRLTLGDGHWLPSYVLLDETLGLGDSIPTVEPILSFLFDIHKRRDKVVYFFTRTDCQIRSPTFATLRAPPFTLHGVLGEPLKGPDLAMAVPPHSREWERAMACLKQGLRNSVSADWWRRVLVLAPQFAQPGQVNTQAEFSSPMLAESLVLRTLELLRPNSDSSSSGTIDSSSWQEWRLFADLLFQIVRSGHVDFGSYIDNLSRQGGPNGPLRSPLLAWLLSQVLRLEAVVDTFRNGTPEDKQRTFNLLVDLGDTPLSELPQAPHVAVLLDWSSSFLLSRLTMYSQMLQIPCPALPAARTAELTKRIKESDGWFKSLESTKGPLDFTMMDEKGMGRLWFLSHAKSQEFTKIIINTLKSQGTSDLTGAGTSDALLTVLRETRPLPVGLLTGVGIHSMSRMTNLIEEAIAAGQPLVSVALMETYVRLLLVSPQSLYRKLLESLLNKYRPGDARQTGSILTILELINYRLLPFYRYHNKLRALWGDLDRILAALLTMPGQHRLYRLTENVAMSVLPTIHRDYTNIKAVTKGSQTSETVNRLMILNIAMVSKTRGLAIPHDAEHIHTTIKQILANSTHSWGGKTLRHFPSLLREMLKGREDVRGTSVLSEWQKVGKAAISAHSQLFNPSADSSVAAYLKNVPRESRRWAFVAMWTFMDGRPEKLNLTSFTRALKEFTPEEITGNVYVLVDFILHSMMTRVQKGELEATILARTAANLAYVLWVVELLPYDVTLLALADRDDHPQALSLMCLLLDRPEITQRVQRYCAQRGPGDHWTRDEPPVRAELQAALGNHYAGLDRHPPIYDDLCLRALPVLPVLVGRLVEHERFDAAAKLLTSYAPLLTYHLGKLMLVRDLLAYYHGHMPPKLVLTLLSLLDPQKYSFSDPFNNYMKHPANPEPLSTPSYFLNLVTRVAHVLPSMGETLFSRQTLHIARAGTPARWGGNTPASSTPWELTSVFAKHQDCATQGQLLMTTAEVELLALPFSIEKTVKGLVGAALYPENVAKTERGGRPTMGHRQAPGGTDTSPLYRPGITPSAAQFAEATGILLAQLPSRAHPPFFEEIHSAVTAAPWFNGTFDGLSDASDKRRFLGWPLAAEVNNASEEGTATSTGQTLGMVHAFAFSVSYEWLNNLTRLVLKQRPIRSGAHLRFCFKLVGPTVPAFASNRPLFAKMLALLFTILADVFGRTSQTTAEDALEMSDLVDFLHHAITLEGRSMTPGARSAHLSTLKMCTQAVDRLHPELQKLFKHLTLDPNKSLFAAELAQSE